MILALLVSAQLFWSQPPGVGSNYVVFSTTDYQLGLVARPIIHGKSMWGSIIQPATNAMWTLIGTTTNRIFEVVIYRDESVRFFDSYAAPIDDPIVDHPNFAIPSKTTQSPARTAGSKQGKM